VSKSFDGGPVGYKRPPAEHQFKKGRKPAGSGRRKGSRNYETIVSEILEQPVAVTLEGKRKMIPGKEALLRRAFADAANGDTRNIARFFALCQRLAPQLLDPDVRPIRIQMVPGDETL
jgi:hypothetical protein